MWRKETPILHLGNLGDLKWQQAHTCLTPSLPKPYWSLAVSQPCVLTHSPSSVSCSQLSDVPCLPLSIWGLSLSGFPVRQTCTCPSCPSTVSSYQPHRVLTSPAAQEQRCSAAHTHSRSRASSPTSRFFSSPSSSRLFYSCGHWSRCPFYTLVSAHNNTSWGEILTP